MLRGWDGEFSVLIRKRVARHVEQCATCESTKRRVAPLALLGAAPAFAAPLDLRDRVLDAVAKGAVPPRSYRFDLQGGFPRIARGARDAGAAGFSLYNLETTSVADWGAIDVFRGTAP